MWDDFLELLFMKHDWKKHRRECFDYNSGHEGLCKSCVFMPDAIEAHTKFVIRQFKQEAKKYA